MTLPIKLLLSMSKHKALVTSLALLAASVSQLEAAIGFEFQMPGFGDQTGTPKNGMYWALLVDTEGDGFAVNSFLPFDVAESGQFLTTTSGLSDDYYVFGKQTGLPHPTTEALGPFAGFITGMVEVPLAQISQNNPFAIIWFVSNSANIGDYYGILTSDTWLLPADGQVFAEYRDLTGGSIAAQYVIVPEPSTYALAFGGLALGVVLWRRKKN